MYIRVEVKPGAKKESIKKKKVEHSFLITVKEPAEKNSATRRVRELVAEEYGVRPKDLRLLSGYQSPRKIFWLADEEELS